MTILSAFIVSFLSEKSRKMTETDIESGLQPVNPCGEDEIIFMQAADFVGP